MACFRYETLLTEFGGLGGDMSMASARARTDVAAAGSRDEAIRDVAAGVAAPNIVGFVIWLLLDASQRELRRLCFLSRDAQVFFEIAKRLTPRLGIDLDLRYVYSSRRTWSLAASDPHALNKADWLFNSFVHSNAADVCARLGIDFDRFERPLVGAGVSLDPAVRADVPEQGAALRRFVAQPEVAAALRPRIETMRQLVCEYAVQEGLADETTGMVDAGWTGRMVGCQHRLKIDPFPTGEF